MKNLRKSNEFVFFYIKAKKKRYFCVTVDPIEVKDG